MAGPMNGWSFDNGPLSFPTQEDAAPWVRGAFCAPLPRRDADPRPIAAHSQGHDARYVQEHSGDEAPDGASKTPAGGGRRARVGEDEDEDEGDAQLVLPPAPSCHLCGMVFVQPGRMARHKDSATCKAAQRKKARLEVSCATVLVLTVPTNTAAPLPSRREAVLQPQLRRERRRQLAGSMSCAWRT
jgi:hypothetical protein